MCSLLSRKRVDIAERMSSLYLYFSKPTKQNRPTHVFTLVPFKMLQLRMAGSNISIK